MPLINLFTTNKHFLYKDRTHGNIYVLYITQEGKIYNLSIYFLEYMVIENKDISNSLVVVNEKL
jgi:hypothetical protein